MLEVTLSGEEYEKLMREMKELRYRNTELMAEIGKCLAFITRMAQAPFISAFGSDATPIMGVNAKFESETFIRFFKQTSPVSYDYFILDRNRFR